VIEISQRRSNGCQLVECRDAIKPIALAGSHMLHKASWETCERRAVRARDRKQRRSELRRPCRRPRRWRDNNEFMFASGVGDRGQNARPDSDAAANE